MLRKAHFSLFLLQVCDKAFISLPSTIRGISSGRFSSRKNKPYQITLRIAHYVLYLRRSSSSGQGEAKKAKNAKKPKNFAFFASFALFASPSYAASTGQFFNAHLPTLKNRPRNKDGGDLHG